MGDSNNSSQMGTVGTRGGGLVAGQASAPAPNAAQDAQNAANFAAAQANPRTKTAADLQSTSAPPAAPANATAKDLGQTLLDQLITEAGKPAATFDKPLYAGLSDGTVRSLRNLDNGAGLYQEGLNDSFNTITGMAKNGPSIDTGALKSVVGQYDQLFNQSNKSTMAADHLTGLIPGLKAPSYADGQAKSLYEQTLSPSFAQQGFRDIYGELQDPSYAENGFKSIFERLGGPSITEQNLSGYANGSLIGANPYLDKAIDTTRGNTTAAVNQSFGSSGRLGSGLNVDTLGTALSNTENAARLAQYNQDVQNQFGANRDIEAARASATGQQAQALGGMDASRANRYALQQQALGGEDAATTSQLGRSLSALSAQDAFRLAQSGELRNTIGQIDTSNDNRTNTLSGVLGGKTAAGSAIANASAQGAALQLQAANSAGAAYQNALMPSMTSLAVGGAVDADRQAQLLAENDLFERQNGAQLNKTGNILGLLNGGANTPGIAEETPWWQSVLGAGVGLAGNALTGGIFNGVFGK